MLLQCGTGLPRASVLSAIATATAEGLAKETDPWFGRTSNMGQMPMPLAPPSVGRCVLQLPASGLWISVGPFFC